MIVDNEMVGTIELSAYVLWPTMRMTKDGPVSHRQIDRTHNRRGSGLVIMAIVLCAVLVAAGATSCRCSDSEEEGVLRGPPLTPTAQAWVTSVKTNLPIQLCDHAYFSECFDATEAQCRRQAGRLFDACANEHREVIPDVPTPVSGKQAGRTLGRCVGRRLELSLKEQRLFRDTEQCKEPSNWLE